METKHGVIRSKNIFNFSLVEVGKMIELSSVTVHNVNNTHSTLSANVHSNFVKKYGWIVGLRDGLTIVVTLVLAFVMFKEYEYVIAFVLLTLVFDRRPIEQTSVGSQVRCLGHTYLFSLIGLGCASLNWWNGIYLKVVFATVFFYYQSSDDVVRKFPGAFACIFSQLGAVNSWHLFVCISIGIAIPLVPSLLVYPWFASVFTKRIRDENRDILEATTEDKAQKKKLLQQNRIEILKQEYGRKFESKLCPRLFGGMSEDLNHQRNREKQAMLSDAFVDEATASIELVQKNEGWINQDALVVALKCGAGTLAFLLLDQALEMNDSNVIILGLRALQSCLRQIYFGACKQRVWHRLRGSFIGFVYAGLIWEISTINSRNLPHWNGWSLVVWGVPLMMGFLYQKRHDFANLYISYAALKDYTIIVFGFFFAPPGGAQTTSIWVFGAFVMLWVTAGSVIGLLLAMLPIHLSARRRLRVLLSDALYDVIQSMNFETNRDFLVSRRLILDGKKLLKVLALENKSSVVAYYERVLQDICDLDQLIWREKFVLHNRISRDDVNILVPLLYNVRTILREDTNHLILNHRPDLNPSDPLHKILMDLFEHVKMNMS